MSVKKLLILLTAAGVSSLTATVASAGGPDMMASPPQLAPENCYFYVEGSVGYGWQDFDNFKIEDSEAYKLNKTPSLNIGSGGDGATGNLSYGGDIGYMFNQYVGSEIGWSYLPSFSASPSLTTPSSVSVEDTGAAWGVIKLVAPVSNKIDAFFKSGVTYRYGDLVWNSRSGLPFVPGKTKIQEWRPVFGAGLTYNFAHEWMASLSWMHIMGGTGYTQVQSSGVRYLGATVPSVDVLSFSLGYKFTV